MTQNAPPLTGLYPLLTRATLGLSAVLAVACLVTAIITRSLDLSLLFGVAIVIGVYAWTKLPGPRPDQLDPRTEGSATITIGIDEFSEM